MKPILKISIMFISLFLLIGCNSNESDYSTSDFEAENHDSNALEDNEIQAEEYVPEEGDVLFKDNAMNNKNLLDAFIDISGKNNDSKLRVVKYDDSGAVIYNLLSRYDKNADVGWIEVTPDLTYYTKGEDTVQDVFNNAPQQCASLTADVEKGFYTFHECRTHWEYPLVPIVTTALSGEEIENINEPEEIPEIVIGNEYYLVDPMTEVFLSKKDAKEWYAYYVDENEKKVEEAKLDNIVKLLENRVELDRVTDNKVRVISCGTGICEVYSDATFQLKVFAVPEVKINTKERVEGTEEISDEEQESVVDEVEFWMEINQRISGIIEDTSKLIELYQTDDIFEVDKEAGENLYHRVDGNTIIIQYTTPPAIPAVEEKYYEILMDTGFLFNALHQAEVYIENGEKKKLEALTKDEIIPLRDELEALSEWISELENEE